MLRKVNWCVRCTYVYKADLFYKQNSVFRHLYNNTFADIFNEIIAVYTPDSK